MVNYCFGSSSFFLPKILSAVARPKHPNASKATDSTNTEDGAMCASLKLFTYKVMHKATVHKSPHRRFIEITPFSSENNDLINCFMFLIYLCIIPYIITIDHTTIATNPDLYVLV